PGGRSEIARSVAHRRFGALQKVQRFARESPGPVAPLFGERLGAVGQLRLARRGLFEVLAGALGRRLPEPLERALGPTNFGLQFALCFARIFSRVAAEAETIGARALRLIERL